MGRKREREPVLVQSGMKDQHLRMSSALQEYMHTHTCVNTNVRGHTNTFLKVVLGAILSVLSHDAPISMACPGVEG